MKKTGIHCRSCRELAAWNRKSSYVEKKHCTYDLHWLLGTMRWKRCYPKGKEEACPFLHLTNTFTIMLHNAWGRKASTGARRAARNSHTSASPKSDSGHGVTSWSYCLNHVSVPQYFNSASIVNTVLFGATSVTHRYLWVQLCWQTACCSQRWWWEGWDRDQNFVPLRIQLNLAAPAPCWPSPGRWGSANFGAPPPAQGRDMLKLASQEQNTANFGTPPLAPEEMRQSPPPKNMWLTNVAWEAGLCRLWGIQYVPCP